MLEKNLFHADDDDDVTRVQSADSKFATHPANTQTTNTTVYSDNEIAEMQLAIGSVIKDTYQLVEVLGEGGMGTVFKALNKVWEEVEARDPYVAIKVLKPELSANKQLVRSLYSDFDRTKMLANCPNIIKVHGFDRDGPHVYMTMEYLTGKTLGDYLNRQPMNLTQAWFIIEGVGNALAYAHEHNIVHRDIKPGNIIITNDNIVKVLDFGIASKINENEGDETKFGGHELGALTVAYASPEMQRDFPPDARDDIYAFACVIYEILTGNQFYKQKINKAAGIHGLNSRQMEILNKSLAFERDQRTATIRELLEKLRPVTTPWVKYAAISGCVVFIIGLALVFKPDTVPPKQDTVVTPPVEVPIVKPPVEVPIVKPPVEVPIVKPPVEAPIVKPPVEAPIVKPPVEVPIVKPPVEVPIVTPVLQSGTSSDGVIQLQTSKPEYNNGEPFHLSFSLTQASYVRVIDRDPNGKITTLRPNPVQPDKLLPANKEQIFPPADIEVPVEGMEGKGIVTLIASSKPFSKKFTPLNTDGSVSEQVQNGAYSWVQVHYTLHP